MRIYKVTDCRTCPFAIDIAPPMRTICDILSDMQPIALTGIRDDCPLKNGCIRVQLEKEK